MQTEGGIKKFEFMDGSKVWFTSDTHFSHANIIRFCKRPFADVEEMNEYIINVRLNAAKALLSSSAYTVNEISEQLGCENANRFTKFFKYHTGISPQEYRKTH